MYQEQIDRIYSLSAAATQIGHNPFEALCREGPIVEGLAPSLARLIRRKSNGHNH